MKTIEKIIALKIDIENGIINQQAISEVLQDTIDTIEDLICQLKEEY